ncbi:hypothetical protein J6590_053983 [Homalodisca vitripennis]|nr:hypothetical protein J6590_053983 [Homalodisca vitripennis]
MSSIPHAPVRINEQLTAVDRESSRMFGRRWTSRAVTGPYVGHYGLVNLAIRKIDAITPNLPGRRWAPASWARRNVSPPDCRV